MPPPRTNDRRAEHWRRLGLLPGAPACVIKAAHRAQIELHHPDRGGDLAQATLINVAYDEVRELGAPANEYVAANYNAEPWVVLGLTSMAGEALAERAGKQLLAELRGNRRLSERVRWAVDNYSRSQPPPPRDETAQRRLRHHRGRGRRRGAHRSRGRRGPACRQAFRLGWTSAASPGSRTPRRRSSSPGRSSPPTASPSRRLRRSRLT